MSKNRRTGKKLTREQLVELGAVEIATDGTWSIFARLDKPQGEWSDYYLRNWQDGRGQRAFHLGTTGGRLPWSKHAAALEALYPEAYDDVEFLLVDHHTTAWLFGDAWRPELSTWWHPADGEPSHGDRKMQK